MKIARRKFLRLAAASPTLSLLPRAAKAQSYPARPIRLIVQVPPGGSPDIVARVMGQWLSEKLGQPVVVDNRPGASGNIATEFVTKATPDGYTLLLSMSSNAINASLYQHLNFNFMQDTAPVASISLIPLVMDVNPAVPAKSVPEFIDYVKANPGKVNLAASGVGTPLYVAGALFKMMTGLTMLDVNYQGEVGGDARSAERTGAGHVRRDAGFARLHQVRPAPRARGDVEEATGTDAGRPGDGRICAGL